MDGVPADMKFVRGGLCCDGIGTDNFSPILGQHHKVIPAEPANGRIEIVFTGNQSRF
jgi:hypothetical protein